MSSKYIHFGGVITLSLEPKYFHYLQQAWAALANCSSTSSEIETSQHSTLNTEPETKH